MRCIGLIEGLPPIWTVMCWVWEDREEQRNHRCPHLYPPESDEAFLPHSFRRSTAPPLLQSTFETSFNETLPEIVIHLLYIRSVEFEETEWEDRYRTESWIWRKGWHRLAQWNEERGFEEIKYVCSCLMIPPFDCTDQK